MSVEERVLGLEKYRDELRSAITVYPNLIRFNRPHTGDWVYLTTPMTSTSWDGDAHSTTAKTVIDLSAVFGLHANIKAVLVKITANDSASSTSNCYIALAPNDTADIFQLVCKPYGMPNDALKHDGGIVNCDANGDIYFQALATGANTLDVHLQIWGYYI